MYELSRIRLYSIGPAGARYADTVLDLRGVGEPVPAPAPTQAEFFEEDPVGPPRRPAPAGGLFLEKSDELRKYIFIFEQITAAAIPPDESVALIAKLAKEPSWKWRPRGSAWT